MQKRKKLFHSDTSRLSVTKLQDRAKEYLQKFHNIHDPWVPDYFEEHRDGNYEDVLDVVLLGDFLNKIIMSGVWPFEQYRFWVMGNQVKKVMVNVLGFDHLEISVIPRETLSVDPQIELSKIKRFVYVGQIREEKNLLVSLYLVYLLQKKENLKIRFDIFGAFFLESDDQDRIKYKENVILLINELDWLIKPELKGFDDTIKYDKFDCYLNLSTYCFEDYSLSTQEADSMNVTKIISGWGGMFDSEKNNSYFIPPEIIGRNNTSNFECYLKAKVILNNLGSGYKNDNEAILHEVFPVVVSRKRLDDIRKNFIKKYGQSFYVGYKSFDCAIDSNKAHAFLSLYEESFTGLKYSPSEYMIISDLDLFDEIAKQRIEDQVKGVLVFIHVANLKFKIYQSRIINAKKVYCPLEYKELETIKTLSSLIGESLIFI